MEDRSQLCKELQGFSQRKLKKVETKVVTASGEQLVEKRGAKGLQVLTADGGGGASEQPVRKLDLQVGFIVPGLLIGSQDVAHDKSSLDSYGITHILNLDSEIENKFEDDYNYKNIPIEDKANFELAKVFDDCFDFIDDGRHYGNVLVHCSGIIGLSRSTSICVAYLMSKEKQTFPEALNNVKEVRSFVKPNEGFMKQLQEYEVKLRGAQEIKESGIDDPFALRKKQEIEQEKAMVAGATSVKNRMKLFGATLDAAPPLPANRSKSVSPSPYQKQTNDMQSSNSNNNQSKSPASKWSSNNTTTSNVNRSNQLDQVTSTASKSMTPEPRLGWQQQQKQQQLQPLQLQDSWRQSAMKPPTSHGATSTPPPPPPPPPPPSALSAPAAPPTPQAADSNQRMVFGRVRPPPMKIVGGISIEKHDSVSDRAAGLDRSQPQQQQKSSLQLPLKKQITSESSSSELAAETRRSPSPSAALRAVKQQVAAATANDQQTEREHHATPLNRSSTKKLLNLIKTKTKSDLVMRDGDEDDEIAALLGALENESIDNIDWDELGLDEQEVKGIIANAGGSDSDSDSDDEEDEDDDDDDDDDDDEEQDVEVDDEDEEEEVERSTQHFVIRNR